MTLYNATLVSGWQVDCQYDDELKTFKLTYFTLNVLFTLSGWLSVRIAESV